VKNDDCVGRDARTGGFVNVILAVLAVAVWWLAFTARTSEAVLEPPPSKWDAQLVALDKQALDQAYVKYLQVLLRPG
jgi:hypothetical protein